MNGRVRLCPYYFVTGEAEAARAKLGGVLATICPANKKIIHGCRRPSSHRAQYEWRIQKPLSEVDGRDAFHRVP